MVLAPSAARDGAKNSGTSGGSTGRRDDAGAPAAEVPTAAASAPRGAVAPAAAAPPAVARASAASFRIGWSAISRSICGRASGPAR